MTKLEKLYSIIENSREFGVELPQDVLQQVEELEERIIKEEILPSLSRNVEPLLEPIRRDLVLVMEYHPGEEISVALSRKVKVAESLGAKPLEYVHQDGTSVSSKTGLRVILPNGEIIQEEKTWGTFVEAIKFAGVERVRKLNLALCGVPLIIDAIDPNHEPSNSRPIGNGLYVFTLSNTQEKAKRLEKIGKALGIDWSVEIVSKVK
jgi:hypothetical protein